MGIQVSWDGYITVSGTDLSDHCVQLTLNDGQESRDVTAMGDTSRRYRAALGTASVTATFLNDHSSGSIENTLRTHLLADNTPGDKAPASAPSVALAGTTGELIAGTYRYYLTYTFPAFETAPSTAASQVIASSTEGAVALTSIPASTEWFVTGKNIYRTTADGAPETARLVTALANSATSYADSASSGSLATATLMSQIWRATGFNVVVRKHDTAASTDNPEWNLTAIIDGDMNSMDDRPGEVSQMTVTFRPFGAFSMVTT